MNPSGGTGIGLQYTDFSAKRIGDHARTTFVTNAIGIPEYVTCLLYTSRCV